MVFSSIIFLWIFLPLVFIINIFLQGSLSNYFLLLASLVFYTWGGKKHIVLLLVSIFINWLAGKLIEKYDIHKKWFLAVAVAADLALLGFFKYAGFLARVVNGFAGRTLIPVPNIILPIGISFFTFQAISYVVDVYRGQTKAQGKLVNTALYISFFPQLIAGPIVRYQDINMQLENRRITWDKVAEGFRRFIYGLSKKVLIANVLGACADKIYSLQMSDIAGTMAWLAAFCYMFQIYYDFSGYSDMAIGMGRMFGFDFPENFNYPYVSHSIQEFWRKWHISLSTWFREYVYIPLGGNRRGQKRTYINLLMVFFLTGLWHGAGWNYILWGLYHGFFLVAERMLNSRKLRMNADNANTALDRSLMAATSQKIEWLRLNKIASFAYVFFVVNFGWILFRNEIGSSLSLLAHMLMPWRYQISRLSIWECADYKTLFILASAALGMGWFQTIIPEEKKEAWRFSLPDVLWCAMMLVLSIAAIASDTYNPFIYFQF